jgi:hypothetical protein
VKGVIGKYLRSLGVQSTTRTAATNSLSGGTRADQDGQRGQADGSFSILLA